MSGDAAPPPFTLEIEDRGSAVVVRCHGKLLAGCTDLLWDPVSQLLPTHQRLILDLADLTHIDSMGLGSLVRIYVAAPRRGCSLELLNPGRRVRDILTMTHLLSSFTIIEGHDLKM